MENKYVARDAKNKQNPRISKNGATQAQSTKYNVEFGQFVHKHDENAHKMARFFLSMNLLPEILPDVRSL